MNILKSRELRILYNKDAISMILEIELWSTLLNVSYVKEIRFREINNTIK